jgi:predicted DNA-binding protein with PD1-like motif
LLRSKRTFVVILDPGEEAFSTISDFAVSERFSTASLTVLGPFSQATVGCRAHVVDVRISAE